MTRFVDYFVLCGLKGRDLSSDSNAGFVISHPPLSRCYSSHVLYHFPDNVDYLPFDEGAIQTQCMPDGVKLAKNICPRPKFHTMLITKENGSRVYGSVLIFYEPTRDQTLLDAFAKLQNEYESNSRFEINPDDSLLLDQTCDELYSSSALCFITSIPVFNPLKAYLDQVYAITMEGESTNLSIESYLYNLLYEVCLPDPGRMLSFTGPLGAFSWYHPGKLDLPLCDYSFKVFFSQLGAKNIIKFLTCVLLEQQILLKSSDFHLLMLCAECITALMFPFSWPHVFVPILPSSQKGFLDAPVPFIMGLRMDADLVIDELDIVNKTSLCSVDIDLGLVNVPEEEMPLLPDHDKLIARLSEVLKQHGVYCHDLADGKTFPLGGQETKKTVIMDALRFVKSMSEGPPAQPINLPKRRGIPLTHSSSLTHVTDHSIVKEIHGIMMRSDMSKRSRGGNKEDILQTSTDAEKDTTDVKTSDENERETVPDQKWDFIEDESDSAFNNDIRMVFLNYFVEHFANYEHFSIMPNQTYQQWTRNREQFLNFDKTSFLSDQPNNHRPFYSAFLQTTMFSNVIDQKLMQWWDSDMTSPNLFLFDKCVESYRQNSGIPTTPTTGNTPATPTDFDDGLGISQGSLVAPKPSSRSNLGGSSDETIPPKTFGGVFPKLDYSLLIHEIDSSVSSSSTDIKKPNRRPKPGGGGSTGSFDHSKFVMQLWRECRSRVKHMLGSSAEAQSNIEANTQIANLCDLLERIWGHGLKRRDQGSKSPLWAHLIAFGEFLCHHESSPPPITTTTPERARTSSTPNVHHIQTVPTPPHSARGLTKSARSTSVDESNSPQQKRVSRQRFRSPALKMRIEGILQPPTSTFLEDLRIVNNMREIKTDVGRARAWVRLVLEKKSLSRHLTQLLSNVDLCRKRYRHYSFLLTEDEKEQFLLHLLTLSAGDFTCYTTGFITTTMSYRVLVVGEGKYFGLTTSSLYVNVGGENGESGILEIPKGEYQLEFSCNNLGTLTCLRLGHDNSGLIRSLMVEMVLVLCITTGQTYKFSCGRPLSKGDDDGSVERLLFGERISRKLNGSTNISALCLNDVLPSGGTTSANTASSGMTWTRSPKKEDNKVPMLSDIKSSLTNSICRMLKVIDGSPKETTREKLLLLLYGPDGFIKSLFTIFLFGFKASRGFQKRQLYIWDIIERCLEDMPCPQPITEAEPSDDEETVPSTTDSVVRPILPTSSMLSSDSQVIAQHSKHLKELVSKINNFPKIGKHEKAVILFSIGIRDKVLRGWIESLALSTAIGTLYEPTSFFCDYELRAYLLQTVQQTNSLNYIVCEPLLTQGL